MPRSQPSPQPAPEPRPPSALPGPQTRPGSLEQLSQVRFLTVAEVAAVMRVSRMTVYRLVHAGDLASVRVGRSFRVPERAVHDYLRGAFTEAG
jgi:excisionase family DNA binding protein